MNTTIPSSTAVASAKRASGAHPLAIFNQIGMLAWRALIVNLRVPAFLASLVISLFTLFVYRAQFSGISAMFLPGQSYLGFILPISIVSAALSGSGVAGQTIVNDIERGYFDKLRLTPVNRWALLLGPMLAGGIILAVQTVLILLVGLALGLEPATGVAGLAVILGLAVLIGVGFSGLSVGLALVTGNAAATNSASFLFFPLTFLTATFVPVEQLQGWIRVAARINPVTYLLEAMRALLNTGWNSAALGRGFGASAALFAVLFAWALWGLRTRTRRR